MRRQLLNMVLLAGLAIIGVTGNAQAAAEQSLLNVSYDPTRELYQDINAAFARKWAASGNGAVEIRQSHGGSGKQARAVIDGLPADVVTLALAGDIDEIAQRSKLLPANWQARLPHHSAPYYSTIVFLVRKGNPKAVRDWGDLVKPGIQVITPNPKTSGGARWNWLAAYGYALRTTKSAVGARNFMVKLLHNVPILDTGARGATTTFVQRGQGDVLLTWENEAFLAVKELGEGQFEIVVPSVSILAEPPVAVIDKNVDAHGTRKLATAYLNYLYTPAAQEIIARNYYRPRNGMVSAKYSKRYPKLPLFTIDKNFGGWKKVQSIHFDGGGLFDQVFEQAKR